MAVTRNAFCVLFFLFSLSSSAAAFHTATAGVPWTYSGSYGLPEDSSATFFKLEENWGAFPASQYRENELPSCYMQPPPGLSTNASYGELTRILWEKISNDMWKHSQQAQATFVDYWESYSAILIGFLRASIGAILWLFVWLWTRALLVGLRAIWFLVTGYAPQTLCLVALGITTCFVIKAIIWLFGAWVPYLASLFAWSTRTCLKLFKRSSFTEEQMSAGFKSYNIPQIPPKKSVVVITHPDSTHKGYGTCVKLENGSVAIVTAYHCVDESKAAGAIIQSYNLPSRPAVKAKDLEVIWQDKTADLIFLAVPAAVQSALALKGVSMITADTLAKGPVGIYSLSEDGVWTLSNGQILESADPWRVPVLSNTGPGHSGAAYFACDKVAGIHVGFFSEDSSNRMVPIPPIPGMTKNRLVFETTAPTGRVFTATHVENIVKRVDELLHKFKPKSGVLWADLVEEDEDDERFVEEAFYDAKPSVRRPRKPRNRRQTRLVTESTPSGNGRAELSAVPTAPAKAAERPAKTTTAAPSAKPTEADHTAQTKVSSAPPPAIESELSALSQLKAEMQALMKQMSQPQHHAWRYQKPKGGKRKQHNTKGTSNPSTNGRLAMTAASTSRASSSADVSPAITTPLPKRSLPGVHASPRLYPAWLPKSPASAGHASGSLRRPAA